MKIDLNEQHRIIRESIESFFNKEVNLDPFRSAESIAFDPILWKKFMDMGAVMMRAPDSGDGMQSLAEAILVVEQAGSALAPVPVAEAMMSRRILGSLDSGPALHWRQKIDDGEAIVTLAVSAWTDAPAQVVPGGAIAQAVIGLDRDRLIVVEGAFRQWDNFGGVPAARIDICGQKGQTAVLASGPDAISLYQATCEEWKLLNAAYIVGAANRGIRMAAEYVREREAFGRPIGAFQGVAHALADAYVEIVGAELLIHYAIQSLAERTAEAGAHLAAACWWAATAGPRALATAVHVHGGHGLALESNVPLYFRKAKALALLSGDPQDDLVAAGRRLWLGETPEALPDAGPPCYNFEFGDEAEKFAEETRKKLEALLTPEHRARAHFSFEGHDWEIYKAMGATGHLQSDWPKEHGGLGKDIYSTSLAERVWDEFRWSRMAVLVTHLAGNVVIRFGSPSLKEEILPRLASGEASCTLGFSEPGGGSDVFAARTKAVRDGDEWIINGQKMWTSGAELADYVLILVRTDLDAPKHLGLTVFLVPMSLAGIAITPIETLMDERTNMTFYSDVRVHDRYRLGEVNGGIAVMAAALEMEQGGGATWVVPHAQAIDIAVNWARETGRIGQDGVLGRLAAGATHALLSDLIYRLSVYKNASGQNNLPFGPMSKLFSSELYKTDTNDLLELTAPWSMGLGREDVCQLNRDHRRAHGATVYGGASEVHRSMVAEKMLGLPRSRS